jgi:hypothetical protein
LGLDEPSPRRVSSGAPSTVGAEGSEAAVRIEVVQTNLAIPARLEKKSSVSADGEPAAAKKRDLAPLGFREPAPVRFENHEVISAAGHFDETIRKHWQNRMSDE